MMLAKKRIVITGASRGIGRAMALACAREGATVGINYRVSEEGIDGWVNNAAVNRPGLLVSVEDEDLRAQVDINLVGPILCTRCVLPRLSDRAAFMTGGIHAVDGGYAEA